MRTNVIVFILFCLFILFVFPFLFTHIPISGGDYTPTTLVIQKLSANFFGWCGYRDLGFNCVAINLHYSIFWMIIYFFSSVFSLPGAISERIFLWFPFFILCFISTTLLVKKAFPETKFWFLAPFLYVGNTYALMLLGGGQISGIGLGYALVPLILFLWIRLIEKQNFLRSIIWGTVMALLIALDPRIGFIGGVLCVFYALAYWLYYRKYKHFSFWNFSYTALVLFFLPFFITVVLHFYWILPTLVYRENPLHELGPAYDTVGAVKFFSFATFENALGLLHPNWPENIFGLTHFMRPEFLFLPLLIFSSLIFIKKGKHENFFLLFFLLLALLGVFLAKGANAPFGEVYLWMFERIPGFSLFRDSTKWYLFVALSYCLVLPFIAQKVYSWLALQKDFLTKLKIYHIQNLFLIILIGYLLFLLKPAIQGQLTGTFTSHAIPSEYTQYQKFIDTDMSFSRTFWVPVSSRYGQFDIYHPTIDAGNFLHASQSGILADFQNPGFEMLLQEASVKYVVVPDDVNHEIFIQDRKYSEKTYQNAIVSLKNISWLGHEQKIGRIILFTVPNFHPHFWLTSGKGTVRIMQKDPDTYAVHVEHVTQGQQLVFSEDYNKGWIAFVNQQQIFSTQFHSYFNSFILPKSGSYTLSIRFVPQNLVEKGLWISGSFAFLICVYFIWHAIKNVLK